MPESKKIVLDTNFLLIPGQFGVDIFSEIERICPFRFELQIIDLTLKELANIIAEQRGKAKAAAKIALGLVEAKKLKVVKAEARYADKALFDMADSNTLVATQDKELKNRLAEKGARVITLRQKKYLVME